MTDTHVRTNEHGQSIGHALDDWTPGELPPLTPIEGRFCRIERASAAQHGADLHAANLLDTKGRNWTYLGYGPFASLAEFMRWFEPFCESGDPMCHTIVDLATGKAVGVASLMRIDPPSGVIEVGHINYSPRLQQRPAATEAMYLLMRRVFDELGYRRYEWKCDDLNAPSRRAAQRLGFTYEGTFRQAVVYRQRNRDTAWFSIIDSEWPQRRAAFEAWLARDNFDETGRQRRSLSDIRSLLSD